MNPQKARHFIEDVKHNYPIKINLLKSRSKSTSLLKIEDRM